MPIKVQRTAATDRRYMKLLIAGDPGAGKTRFGRSWDQPFYISAEAGLMSVQSDDLPFHELTNTSELLELLTVLRQKPEVREQSLGTPVNTVIIDTIDEVQRMLHRERIKEQKHEAMGRDDWGVCGDKLRDILRNFRNLDLNVIFTVHTRDTQEGDDGPMVVQPLIQGSVREELAAFFDLVLLFGARPMTVQVNGKPVRKVVRYAQTYPDARHSWLKDRSGRLPMEFEINFEDDYRRLSALIWGPGDVKAPVPPDPISSGAASATTPVDEAQAFLDKVNNNGKADKGTDSSPQAATPAKKVAPAKKAPPAAIPVRNQAPAPAPEPVVEEATTPFEELGDLDMEAGLTPEPEPEPLVAEPDLEPVVAEPAAESEPEPEVGADPDLMAIQAWEADGTEETPPPEPEATEAAVQFPCDKCGNEVIEDEYKRGIRKYGAHLCKDCVVICEMCGKKIEGKGANGPEVMATTSYIRYHKRLCAEDREAIKNPRPKQTA
jgi:AAA domain